MYSSYMHTHIFTPTYVKDNFLIVHFFAVMLVWFVSSADIRKALGEELAETRPEKIPDCCTDENINVNPISRQMLGK